MSTRSSNERAGANTRDAHGQTDAPPGPTLAVAYATALFAMPAVMIALIWLDRWSAVAAAFAR